MEPAPSEAYAQQGAAAPGAHTPSPGQPGTRAQTPQTWRLPLDGADPSWLLTSDGVDQMFDYASFMWHPGVDVGGGNADADGPQMTMDQLGGGWDNSWQSVDVAGISMPPRQRNANDSSHAAEAPSASRQVQTLSRGGSGPAGTRTPSSQVEDHDLLNYFVRTVVPPIVGEVETQKRWCTMRQILMSMCNTSAMVRCAILTFSSLLFHRSEDVAAGVVAPPSSWASPTTSRRQGHYDTALGELVLAMQPEQDGCAETLDGATTTAAAAATAATATTKVPREHLLATLFFLSYVDILQDRMTRAHEHLNRAYGIFQEGNKRGFRPVEIRLLSWIRLLDARAVSAGGEGLFLSDKSEALIVHPSPAGTAGERQDAPRGGRADEGGGAEAAALDEVKDWDVEDVLFQALHQPGIVFFQKVLSFMGRISMIDPWHRSRGTVEDETEVMQIASRILKDLAQLHDDRPPLLDHAVGGALAAPLVAPALAVPITRAFRTYLSNYYASKVHLHRVAHRHLPLSRDTADALQQIRRLTSRLVEDLEPGAALPVTQLWPLLMLGSEEQDLGQRAWVKEQIVCMEKVATNARLTAEVLREVQERQDAKQVRVDIRSVMHDIFDSCFAIM